MKQFFLLITALNFTSLAVAQAPQKFSSQIVVRDAANELVIDSPVGIRVSILQGAPDGAIWYSETHQPTTNSNGLASMEIGTGSDVISTFTGIDWKLGPYFIKTEVDPTGGTNYSISGTTELLSVPYALHAETDGDWSVSGLDVFVSTGRNVGIGTDSPQAKLDIVDGDALINGLTIGRGPGPHWGSTVIGSGAMSDNSLGSSNTAIGYNALSANDTGQGNTAVGFGALVLNTEGIYNTAIGLNATVGAGNLTNATAIGAYAQVTQSNSLVLGNSNTNSALGTVDVGIGVTAPNEKLEIGGDGRAFFGDGEGGERKGLLIDGIQGANAARIEAFNYGTGNGMDLVLNSASTGGNVGVRTNNPTATLSVNGSANKTGGGSWAVFSDRRLKKDIISYEDGLSTVLAINPVTFKYNGISDADTLNEYVGVIAQELEEVSPYMINSIEIDGTEYLEVDNSAMTYMLINAVKEQQEIIENLQAENTQHLELIEANNQLLLELTSTLKAQSNR